MFPIRELFRHGGLFTGAGGSVFWVCNLSSQRVGAMLSVHLLADTPDSLPVS